jgi:hypothetical protein
MFRVVRICISMHDSCIRLQEGKEKGGVLNSVLQVIKTLPRSKKSVGRGTFPSNSSKLGFVSRELTHSPAPPTPLLNQPVHFCLNGITVVGWAPSWVFAASRVDSARRKKRGDTFHRWDFRRNALQLEQPTGAAQFIAPHVEFETLSKPDRFVDAWLQCHGPPPIWAVILHTQRLTHWR